MSIDSKRERIVRINKTTILFNFVFSEGQNVSIANVANFIDHTKSGAHHNGLLTK